MGGNAIKGAVRMSKESYLDVLQTITKILHDIPHKPTLVLDDKNSFGDVDIVLHADKNVVERFQPIETVTNGCITSIGFLHNGQKIQIDLLFTSLEKIEHVHAYLSYGVFGMCLGIGLLRSGLQYGMDGLKAQVCLGNNEKRWLHLSNSHEDIFRFLGFDTVAFSNGFSDTEQLAVFIQSSNCLDTKSICKNTNPRLDAIKKYLYLTTTSITNAITYFKKNKEEEDMRLEYEKSMLLKSKFNGRIVMELTGLSGRELGAFMACFLEKHPGLIEMSDEEIKNAIMCFRM
jgi:hypothetical protein